MSQLEQRINFYQDIFRKPEIRFPLQQMLAVWALVLVVLAMVTLVDFVRVQSQRGKVEKLQVTQTRMEAAVTQMAEQLAKRVIDPVLQKKETDLRQTLQGKQQFLSALKAQGDTHQMRFSGVLDGLAQRDTGPLWLTRIHLRSPGPELTLDGLTTEAKAVPEYLAALHQETVFGGMEFRMLTVERQQERGRYLAFSVSTRHDDKPER